MKKLTLAQFAKKAQPINKKEQKNIKGGIGAEDVESGIGAEDVESGVQG